MKKHRDTCISTTSNPVHSDNERQFTKLAKKRSRVKDVKGDSAIQPDPNPETTHLTNTGVTSSNMNEVSHILNKENRPLDKERDKLPPPCQNSTNPKNLKHQCSSLGIA